MIVGFSTFRSSTLRRCGKSSDARRVRIMDKPQFIYVTYIAASADDVWNAIVDPKIAATYWQNVNLSDWKPV